MKKFLGVVFVSSCFLLPGCAHVDSLHIKSALGNADAQYELACKYKSNEYKVDDIDRIIMVLKYLRKAAENGNAKAASELGCFYGNGIYVLPNLRESVKWYRLSIEHGNEEHIIYKIRNEGIEKFHDRPENARDCHHSAVEYFLLASESDDYISQAYLSVCYDCGYGISKDSIESEKWYRRSKALREIRDEKRWKFEDGDMERAKGGDSDYQVRAGDYRYFGVSDLGSRLGGSGDYTEAIKWYKLAAEQGNKKAMYRLGDMYFYGIGLEQDYAKAVEWYRQAEGEAAFELAYCYERGLGVNKDHDEALKLYKKMFEYARANKTPTLIDCYYFGLGTEKNYAEILKIVTDNKDEEAYYLEDHRYYLGAIYENGGHGVEKDLIKALKHYRAGSDQTGMSPPYHSYICEPRYHILYEKLHDLAASGDVESQYMLASFCEYLHGDRYIYSSFFLEEM